MVTSTFHHSKTPVFHFYQFNLVKILLSNDKTSISIDLNYDHDKNHKRPGNCRKRKKLVNRKAGALFHRFTIAGRKGDC
jgi:hypothetical protein